MNLQTSRVLVGLGLLVLSAVSSVGAAGPYTLKENALVLPAPIAFETGRDSLAKASEASLQHVVDYLKDKPYVSLLRIEAHSDSQGDEQGIQTLTEKRALAVGRWLVAHGVDCHRLLAVGFGSNKPVAANNTAEGRAQNRRILFVNAALRGRPIGGFPTDGGGRVAGDLCQ